jgi:hypothetical protein
MREMSKTFRHKTFLKGRSGWDERGFLTNCVTALVTVFVKEGSVRSPTVREGILFSSVYRGMFEQLSWDKGPPSRSGF